MDLDPQNSLRIDPKRYPTYLRDRLCNQATEACVQAGVNTLNLYGTFANRVTAEDLYVGPVDAHWNAAGMAVAAEASAGFLRQTCLTGQE